MLTAHIYLHFQGNCKEAFDFYKTLFGGEFSEINTYEQLPLEEGQSISEAEKKNILHIAYPLSDTFSILGSDILDSHKDDFKKGNNTSISIHLESTDSCKHIFQKLSENGEVITPLESTFWGAYYGMCVDQFGTQWMLNCSIPQQSKTFGTLRM